MTTRLPAGWSWLHLEKFASLEPNAITDGPFGSNLKTADYVENGEVRVIRLGNLGVGHFIDDDRSFVSTEKFVGLRKHEACPGDLVVAALAEPVGRCVEVPGHLGRALVKADCIRVRVNPAFDRRYLLHALNSPGGRSRAEAAAHGMGRLRMNLGDVRSLLVPTAPPAEQRRIVAKLEALQSRSRRAREALDAVPPLLEKLRQSILAAAFRGDLTKDWRAKHKDVEPASKLLERIRAERRKKWEEGDLARKTAKGKPPGDDTWKEKYGEPQPVNGAKLPELPEGWCWASVAELSTLITSGSRGWAEYYSISGPLFVRSQDINSDVLRLGEVAHVQVPASREGARTRVQQGDVLITITGANVTRCAWVTQELSEAYVSQHVALVRPVAGVEVAFLHLWLVAETGGRRQLKRAAYGLGKPGLNLDDVGSVVVPIPPADEQLELTQRTVDLIGVVAGTSTTVDQLHATLATLDRAILAKAFRGELVPQDPNDEPAEAMLARLRETNGASENGAARELRGRGQGRQRRDRE